MYIPQTEVLPAHISAELYCSQISSLNIGLPPPSVSRIYTTKSLLIPCVLIVWISLLSGTFSNILFKFYVDHIYPPTLIVPLYSYPELSLQKLNHLNKTQPACRKPCWLLQMNLFSSTWEKILFQKIRSNSWREVTWGSSTHDSLESLPPFFK